MSDLANVRATLEFCWGFTHYDHLLRQPDSQTCTEVPCPSIRGALEALDRLATPSDPIQESHEALWESTRRAQRDQDLQLPDDIGPHADGLVDAGMDPAEVESFMDGAGR